LRPGEVGFRNGSRKSSETGSFRPSSLRKQAHRIPLPPVPGAIGSVGSEKPRRSPEPVEGPSERAAHGSTSSPRTANSQHFHLHPTDPPACLTSGATVHVQTTPPLLQRRLVRPGLPPAPNAAIDPHRQRIPPARASKLVPICATASRRRCLEYGKM